MISFDTGTHQFHLRAAAVVLRDGQVLLHRRAGDSFWALPGGHVESGETGAEAIARELQEEISEAALCDRLLWVVENFFIHGGTQHHEVGLYFLAELPPGCRAFGATEPWSGTEPDLTYAWFDSRHLNDVDIRPAFLRKALARAEFEFQHYVHREPNAP